MSVIVSDIDAGSQRGKEGLKDGDSRCDITGPSIPKSFGVHEKATCDEAGTVMYPPVTKSGIKLMS